MLVGILLLYACIMQVWISLRVPLWGDELDTMAPAFRNWRGGHSFWWQIGQYNANPPGDNLVLRWFYRSGTLAWLRGFSPELFWRLPYIFVFTATLSTMFYGAWRWTASPFIGFLAFAAAVSSTGLLDFGNVARFYIWLAFFTTAQLWCFFCLVENRKSSLYYFFSVLTTLGICFHVMVAATGYFFLGWSLAWLGYDIYKARVKTLKRALRFLPKLFFAFLPFIIYKVELKHWIFIPPAWSKESAWAKLADRGPTAAFLNSITQNIPGQPDALWLYLLALLLAAATLYHLARKRLDSFAQGAFLLLLLVACPIALFISAAERNYELGARHFVFEAPVVICAVIFLWQTTRTILRRASMLNARLGGTMNVLIVIVALMIFVDTLKEISAFAEARAESTPQRVTYPLLAWQQAYRAMPDMRALVIVGSQPDDYSPFSDQGEYRAGTMRHYTEEFRPYFYSVKGSFGQDAKPDAEVAGRIERNPGSFDFLLLDKVEPLRQFFPHLPWHRWRCKTYSGDRPLSFCRI